MDYKEKRLSSYFKKYFYKNGSLNLNINFKLVNSMELKVVIHFSILNKLLILSNNP